MLKKLLKSIALKKYPEEIKLLIAMNQFLNTIKDINIDLMVFLQL
jgi:hypothetical protein